MKNYHRIILLPLSLLSVMAIIHNAYLSKETASLHTGYLFWDWLLALVFAIGIESGLWTLIIFKKKRAVQAYTLTLFSLNVLYYGRDGKLNQFANFIHPETWRYVEGIVTVLIFSALLSGFAYFLTEVAMEYINRIFPAKEKPLTKEVTQFTNGLAVTKPVVSVTDIRQISRETKEPEPVTEPLQAIIAVTKDETVTESIKTDKMPVMASNEAQCLLRFPLKSG